MYNINNNLTYLCTVSHQVIQSIMSTVQIYRICVAYTFSFSSVEKEVDVTFAAALPGDDPWSRAGRHVPALEQVHVVGTGLHPSGCWATLPFLSRSTKWHRGVSGLCPSGC